MRHDTRCMLRPRTGALRQRWCPPSLTHYKVSDDPVAFGVPPLSGRASPLGESWKSAVGWRWRTPCRLKAGLQTLTPDWDCQPTGWRIELCGMIKALLLIFEPAATWEHIQSARRSLVFILCLHLLPLLI